MAIRADDLHCPLEYILEHAPDAGRINFRNCLYGMRRQRTTSHAQSGSYQLEQLFEGNLVIC